MRQGFVKKWAFIGSRYLRGDSVASIARYLRCTEKYVRGVVSTYRFHRSGRSIKRQEELFS